MSAEEEDKDTLNNSNNSTEDHSRNENHDDSSPTAGASLPNGNENSPPCQLDIGLGTHTDNKRNENSINCES